ncbi:aminoglycoside phosphotransferase [Rhodanobacter sp. FW510-R12]|uniref:phosphotransferase enzyme family protein n=1 Tax=unclassified Rhodanobacter TaxID=2621553 RepID=UPI0007A9C220|nr:MULTISPECIES: phosphotransferase [unclassified Rhodanobacter]KZC18241.1 aminoglycoside phosphotransferase [Rhodanobacter sp. FW104-R8]KZC25760.1 aminoglycoside phosphotransferase [Rhodanobacter sp. FW510-T8]KZC32945.1 aminoglycoside phosphotransferase [Rhodanobacter sp. FW510-R10]
MNDPPHLAHGLAGDSTPPDWPPLALDEVAALLRGYPAPGTPLRIDWHSPRPLSAACLVATDRGTLFVKRHHRDVRSVATLEEEHRFIAHLRAHGMPIPAVLPDARGRTAVAIGDWTYEVHGRAGGIDLYREAISWEPLPSRTHALTAGRMLAALHDAATGYRAPQRDTHLLVARSELIRAADPVAALRAQLPQRPGLADYLRGRDWPADLAELLAPWHAAAQPRLARQPSLWTHGDWHVSNLCWSDDGADARIGAVLDFGLADANFALFDLATAIERNAIAWLALDADADAARPDIACALIDGYRRHRPLSSADLHLLADLLPLVHVDFALSEVEYYHAVTRSPANADIAYDTFLRGHPAWFRLPPGQALRQAIRDHA